MRLIDLEFPFCTDIEALLDARLMDIAGAQFKGVQLTRSVFDALILTCHDTEEERQEDRRRLRRFLLLKELGEGKGREAEALLEVTAKDIKDGSFRGKKLSVPVLKVLKETRPLSQKEWRNVRRKLLNKALEKDRAAYKESLPTLIEALKSAPPVNEKALAEVLPKLLGPRLVDRHYHAATQEGFFEVGVLLNGGTALDRAAMEGAARALVEAAPLLRRARGARGGAAGRGSVKSPFLLFALELVRLGVKPTAEGIRDFVIAVEESQRKPELEPMTPGEEKVCRIAGKANARLKKQLDLGRGKLCFDETGEAPRIIYWLKGGKGSKSIGDHDLRTYVLPRLQNITPQK
jgi:hypothetical protein